MQLKIHARQNMQIAFFWPAGNWKENQNDAIQTEQKRNWLMAKNKFRIEMQIRRWHLLIFIFSCPDALFYFVIELLPKSPFFPYQLEINFAVYISSRNLRRPPRTVAFQLLAPGRLIDWFDLQMLIYVCICLGCVACGVCWWCVFEMCSSFKCTYGSQA